MDSSIKSTTGFSLGILSAMAVTASLFVTLPLLSKIQKPPSVKPKIASILIDSTRPAPPPPETRDDSKNQTPPEKQFTPETDRPQRPQPKVDIPRGSFLTGGNGGIEIGIAATTQDPLTIRDMTFNPEEVDQPPRLLRSFPPRYPYQAKRDNLEGWVVLRFVVDAEGKAGKVEVAASEPAGIFEEAALEAVARYRFKPAVKGGESVNCIAKLRILFELD